MALDWYRVRSPSWNLGSCPYSWEKHRSVGDAEFATSHPRVSLQRPSTCPCLGEVTHAGGLEWALEPGLLGHHLLLPALALVSQQHAHGLAASWGRGRWGSAAGQRPQPCRALGESGVWELGVGTRQKL